MREGNSGYNNTVFKSRISMFFSCVILLFVFVGIVPAGSLKVHAEQATSGVYTNGTGVTWSWDENNNTLTFIGNGSGEMRDFGSVGSINMEPFSLISSKENVKVVIGNGIVRIGARTFQQHSYIGSVYIGDDVVSIGSRAFADCPNLKKVSGGKSLLLDKLGAYLFFVNNSSYETFTKTHLDLLSGVLFNYDWSTDRRNIYHVVTLMDYEGKKQIAKLELDRLFYGFNVSDYLLEEAGFSEDQIPKGINNYTWYKKKSGKKEDIFGSDTFCDLTLYGMPPQAKDQVFSIDVSDNKEMVLDPGTDEKDETKKMRHMLFREGITLTAMAAFADLNGIELDNHGHIDEDKFFEWISSTKLYLSAVPESKMSRNEKFYAIRLYNSINTCSHISPELTEDALCSVSFRESKGEDGVIRYDIVFGPVKDIDGIKTGYACDFGELTMKGTKQTPEYNNIPMTIEVDENGVNWGYKTVKIEVKYGKTPDPEDDSDITKLIPYAENVPVTDKEKVIKKTNTDKTDVAGSNHKYYMLKGVPKGKNSIKLTWKSINYADGYIVYGAKCGKKLERIAEIKNGKAKSYTVKKLKKGTYYKYMLLAYKTTSKGDKVILVSKTVHVATNGGKIGNPTAIKLKKSKITVKKGKKASIKASMKKKKKVATHIGPFRYESENPAIAKVDKKGKIKGVSKGKTNILVFTQNGICKKVKVTVK